MTQQLVAADERTPYGEPGGTWLVMTIKSLTFQDNDSEIDISPAFARDLPDLRNAYLDRMGEP